MEELDHLNGVIMLDLIDRITNFEPSAGNVVKNRKIKQLAQEYYQNMKAKESSR